jgi:diphthamide biosynthesis methyltransferase
MVLYIVGLGLADEKDITVKCVKYIVAHAHVVFD